MKRENFTFDTDLRGDDALFIDENHLSGFDVDNNVKSFINEMIEQGIIFEDEEIIFFRVISKGEETHRHGWLSVENNNISIVQWG
jgi:hypothetical protein